jgi:hypothetical protein
MCYQLGIPTDNLVGTHHDWERGVPKLRLEFLMLIVLGNIDISEIEIGIVY